MLSLISLNDPSDRAVLLRCANTLSYIHGISGSYVTEAWKYYIINLRFSKLQQIFRPRIILLIQVHPKKVYSREIKKYQLGFVRVRTHADYTTYIYIYMYVQSTLVISKSKGPSETHRDIRTSTYQMCRIEENTNRTI